MGSITTLAALVAWLVTQDSQLFQFMMLLPMYSGQIGSSYPQVLIQFFFFIMWGGEKCCMLSYKVLFHTLQEVPFFPLPEVLCIGLYSSN